MSTSQINELQSQISQLQSQNAALSADMQTIQGQNMFGIFSPQYRNDAASIENNNNTITQDQAQITQDQNSISTYLPSNFSTLPLTAQAALITCAMIDEMSVQMQGMLKTISSENKQLSQLQHYKQDCVTGQNASKNTAMPDSLWNYLKAHPSISNVKFPSKEGGKMSNGAGGSFAVDATALQNKITDVTTSVNEEMDNVQNIMDQQSNAMQMISSIIQSGTSANTATTSSIGAVGT